MESLSRYGSPRTRKAPARTKGASRSIAPRNVGQVTDRNCLKIREDPARETRGPRPTRRPTWGQNRTSTPTCIRRPIHTRNRSTGCECDWDDDCSQQRARVCMCARVCVCVCVCVCEEKSVHSSPTQVSVTTTLHNSPQLFLGEGRRCEEPQVMTGFERW
jgi:hypothetical protein